MAKRYVGPGGNDGNSGLTWALRKLTLNGVEDTPVVADDLVYVGPGVYREMLTVDVNGGAGTEIVYVGDVTGEHTDGIGGTVRVTGSDNDNTAARANCIFAADKDYREFRGFTFDITSGNTIFGDTGCHHWTIEDCVFQAEIAGACVHCEDADQTNWIIRRCVFINVYRAIQFYHGAEIDNANHLVENCLFIAIGEDVIRNSRVGDWTIRNCVFLGSGSDGVDVTASPNVGHPVIVENCILCNIAADALEGTALGDLVEDYNTFFANTTDRNNVAVGGNSQTYPPLFQLPILHSGASQVSGFKFPWLFGALSEWSLVKAITGSNEPSVDLHGIPRPATAGKNSWGPTQFVDMEVESGTVQAGTYSRVLHDAGQVLVRRIPVTGVQITVTLYMRYETNYAGNLPRMIIKQPGQADRTDTMVAAVNTWEQLSDTFTPSATPGFIEVWAESRNTAGAGSYETFYDTMGVS